MIKIYSKIKLSEELKKKILNQVNVVRNIENAELESAEFIIDSSIISGIKIDINSEIIDLTINNKLEKVLEILQ